MKYTASVIIVLFLYNRSLRSISDNIQVVLLQHFYNQMPFFESSGVGCGGLWCLIRPWAVLKMLIDRFSIFYE